MVKNTSLSSEKNWPRLGTFIQNYLSEIEAEPLYLIGEDFTEVNLVHWDTIHINNMTFQRVEV